MRYKKDIIIFNLFFIFWYLVSLLVNKAFLPGPIETISSLIELIKNRIIFKHLMISLYRVVLSILISLAVSLPIGIFVASNNSVYKALYSYIVALYPMPKVVFLPILVLFFGLGNLSKVVLISLIISFQLLLSIIDSVRSIPKETYLSMYSLSQSFKDNLFHLILPYLLPDLLTAIRISIGTSISVLFISETFASFDGLGYFILDTMERREYNQMYATIIIMSLMGLFLYKIVFLIEKKYCHWKK